jgi:hypothetical protein
MELTGKIKVMMDTKEVSASFRKRELVLTTEGRYPQQILVEFTQDKIGLLDNHRAGDEVRIHIDIRGREWKSPRGEVKYFVSVHGWKIENLAQAQAGPSGGGQAQDAPPFDDAPFPDSPDGGSSFRDDDIPF